MSEIHYAIEINTGVAVNVPQLGQTSDGYMRLITGRPGYDGTPTYPTWEDTTNNTFVWYHGIIAKDGILSPNSMIDIKESGGYATVSGMTVLLSNFNSLWNYLGDNDIYLANRPIAMYIVIDDVFYAAWSGVVTDFSYTETTFKIVCDSNYRKIHKTFPPNTISKSVYPDSSTDEVIPVSLGHIPYAKVVQTGSNDTKIVVDYDIKDNPRYRCSFNTYVPYDYIAILTLKKSYLANELAGKYLRPVNGTGAETERIIKIRSNDASTVGTAYGVTSYFQTVLYIDESFDAYQQTVNGYSYSWLDTKTSVGDTWWFEIIDAKTEFVVSNKPVNLIAKDDYRQTILNYYNEDTGNMYDAHGLVTSIGTNKNRDSIELIRTNENKSGDLTNVVYHGASFDAVNADGAGIYQPFVYAVIGNESNMSDIDRSTETDNIVTARIPIAGADHPDTPHRYEDVVFDVDFSDFDLRDAENICIGMDLEMIVDPHFSATIPFPVGCGCDFRLIDSYGRIVILPDDMGVNYTSEQTCAAYPTETTLDFNFIPNDYYKLGDDNGEASLFGSADNGSNQVRSYLFLPDALVEMIKKDNTYKVRLTLNISSYSNCYITSIKIKQLGVFSYQILETDKDKLFLKIHGGEKYDSSTKTNDCYNAIRHILENYDGISSADIEYDNLPTERLEANGWLLGRQVVDDKNSLDYLREICKYYFIGIFLDRAGILNVTAFKEKKTVIEDFDESNIIRDSIKSLKKIPIVNVYNEFVLKWGYNSGSEKYDKMISISNIDLVSTFPGFLVDDTGANAIEVVSPAVTSFDYYDTGYGVVVFDASIASTLYEGDSVTLYLTSGGIATSSMIYFAKITKVDSDTIYFDKPLIQTTVNAFEIGITNVIIYRHTSDSNSPQWMSLVQGIKEYSVSKSLWDACRASYEKTGVVKAYPDLECDWFIDEETYYGIDDIFYGTSPILFLQNFIDWISVQKEEISFLVPMTATNLNLKLLDYVSFTDAIITLDVMRYGWITKNKFDAKTNTIELRVMLLPGGYSETGDIIETGSAPDIIVESGSQPDDIVEGV